MLPLGYTHYCDRPLVLDLEGFELFAVECRELASVAQKAGLRIAFEYNAPTQPPCFTPDLVRFNGVGDQP